MKTIAFVTPNDSANIFKDLEGELLRSHGCVQSLHLDSDDRQLILNDHYLRICRWLREKECLVYIMWDGNLEDMQAGTFIKDIVNLFFSRPPLLNSSRDSVMHRLVLLQLGAKSCMRWGSTPHNITWFNYKQSPMVDEFDTKQCSKCVCDAVRTKLKGWSTVGAVRNGGVVVKGQDQCHMASSLAKPEQHEEQKSKEMMTKIDKIYDMTKKLDYTGRTILENQRIWRDTVTNNELADDQPEDEETVGPSSS